MEKESDNTEETVFEFPHKPNEKMRLSLRTWKGRRYLSFRAYYAHSQTGMMLPGKQGINLAIEHLPQLEEALAKLRRKIGGKPAA